MPYMKKLMLILSVGLLGCNAEVEYSAETVEGLAALPATAVKEPYEDNSNLIKVTVNGTDHISAQGDMFNGKKAGTWTEYHPNGVVRSVTTYVDGQKQGAMLTIDDRGQLQTRSYYHNGVLHGDYIVYNRTRIKEERHYITGKLEGALKKYYDNGKIMEESYYKNGLMHGMAKWYDQEGNVTIEYEYDNGKLVTE